MTSVPSRRKRLNLGLMALEPRWMFDGAAMADAAPDAAAKALIPDAPAPVQVRTADPAQDGGKKEVVFVDTSVADYQTLEAAVKPGVEVQEIDGGQSGLAQMAKWAETHSGYDSVSVLSHGGEAVLNLGSDYITWTALNDATVQAELAQIGHALAAGGDILLYNCNLAKGDDGQQFIAGLAAATGADVAASDNTTGASSDWTLEKTIGEVTASPLDASSLANYGHDLVGPSAFQIKIDHPSNTNAYINTNASAVDSSGNIYVAGSFDTGVALDSSSPATITSAAQRAGNQAGFIAKYSSSGSFLWSKIVGDSVSPLGTNNPFTSCLGVAVDSSDNVIVTGSFQKTAKFDPGSTNDNITSNGSYDIFVTKFASDGTYGWTKTFGGTGSDNAMDVAVVGGTNIVLIGTFNTSVNFGGTTVTDRGGGNAAYVLCLDAIGATQWVNAYDAYNYPASQAQGTERGYAVDSDGTSIFVSGLISGGSTVNMNPQGTASDLTSSLGGDTMFVQKLNSSGINQWAFALPFSPSSRHSILSHDAAGNVIVAGVYSGTKDFDPSVATHNLSSSGGSTDTYVAKYSGVNGAYIWADSIGGAGTDGGNGIAVIADASNNVYVGGVTNGSSIDLNPAGGGTVSGLSSYSLFQVKLDSSGAYVWGKTGTSSAQINARDILLTGGKIGLVGDMGVGTLGSFSNSGTSMTFNAWNAGFVEGYASDGTPFGGTPPPGPSFTSSATANFAENGTGTAYTAAATGTGTVTYALSGTDAGKFDLNTSTGVLTFKAAPNFEAPGSGASSNSYSVTISATDDNGTASQGVTISVTDVAPAWTAPAPITLNDNSANGAAVATLTGTGDTSGVTWSIQSGNASGLFAINATTGAITVADATKFDVGTTPSYTLSVRETDGTTNADHNITVNVSHVGPTFSSGATTNFAENGAGTVYTAAATASGGTVSYALAGADAGKFNISSTTGAVTFKVPPNFENPASAANSNVYNITINATDNNGTSSKAVAITVTDVAPTWTAPAPVTLNDNSANGVTVATLTGTGDTTGVTWSIQGGNASGLFAINTATGVITVADATKFNFATTPSYTLAIRETDGNTNADHNVTVNVNHFVAAVVAPPPPPPEPKQAPAPAPVVVAPQPAPPPVEQPQTIIRDTTPPPVFAPISAPSQAPVAAPVADAPKAPVAGPVGDSSKTQISEAPKAVAPVTPVVVAPPVIPVVMTTQLTPPTADGGFRVPVVTATQGGPPVEGLLALRPEVQVPPLADGPMKVTIPADAFVHSRSDAVVTLSAARVTGQPLPSWLNFDSRSGTLAGQPPADFKGTMVVRIIARDDKGQEATITVRINGLPEKTGAVRDGNVIKLGHHLRDKPVGKIAFTQQLKLAARNAAVRFS
ncbi:putative Cadherin [Magnetospirillum sp. XM-1]|uniref:DUF4347 domain-containing protein n=1 Tax=Magnetospirillum sp. XM-1 TaxID=1663591 RepID=UPI00073DCE24|nr:DUF4347 domain-containing protein [Magnetospirillum sp. XM-1]CUW40830.1 putative Cadherin [Magnetospirillum sp. XM-1]